MTSREVALLLIGFACGGLVVGTGAGVMSRFPKVSLALETADSSPPPVPPVSKERSSYAFDGYCPVTLLEKMHWTSGNSQYRETHGGLVFLFAGRAEQQRFQNDPDRYAPVCSGNDIVLARDNNETSRGQRQFGVVHDGRFYLFATEASLQRFCKTPERYAAAPDNDAQE